MGMFDISLQKKIKIKKTKEDFLEFLQKKLTKDKKYETNIESNTLTIQKSHIDSLLKYNLKANFQTSKKETELIINAELHDTLMLTILIILAILLTYGIGVIFVVAFTYLQRRKATKYLETLIKDYETIN